MTLPPGLALALAAAAAVGYGLASVLQAVGARGSLGTRGTLTHPLYLLGLGLDLLAWLASLAALRTLPVYEVQAVLAGSLVVTVLAARVALGTRLLRADAVAVAVAVAGLVAIVGSSRPESAAVASGGLRLGLEASAVLVALAGWLCARADRTRPVAVLAGLAFGGAALCARAVTLPAGGSQEALRVVTEPMAWALLVFGVTGMLLYAFALEHGDPGPVTAVLWIAEVVAPALVGATLLGDRARPGWAPVAVVGLVAALLAAVRLAAASTRPGEPAGPRSVRGPAYRTPGTL
jgi:drug/metabolite transporter (DMT)-like permease